MSSKHDFIRDAAEADLLTFIKLVAPHRLLGHVHEDVITWWNRTDAKSHQLLLLPRGHQKSMLIAYRVAWEITRNPAVTILYISATSGLAEKQLKAIQDILTSPIYRRYWPEMVNEQDGKREKWTNTEIAVDHPLRKKEGVRDSTVFTGGLTTSLTGLHCDIAVLDDVVVQENAYTKEGRNKVEGQYSLLSSIENPGAKEWVVGTRYHPNDLYGELIDMREEVFDAHGNMTDTRNVYEVYEKPVENLGDGTGDFIWPRSKRSDGKWFGFDVNELARKRAQYLDKRQYYAQYYNNPNPPEGSGIGEEKFQYYERQHIHRVGDTFFFKDDPLSVYASIDFAFSRKNKADFTAIAVIGVDANNNVFVLELKRFKTDKISEYFKHIVDLHEKWNFRKLRAEVSVGQQAIVRELKDQYIKPAGMSLSVDEFRPNRHQGSKEERMASILEPRYDNGSVWHFKGGMCQLLEEELMLENPPHDDLKDSLASAIDVAVAPRHRKSRRKGVRRHKFHSRFGGVS